ncbi:MAG: LssY C-terminal domain-containing protein [Rhizobiaceae bacterium]
MKRLAVAAAALLLVYLIAAYGIAPLVWEDYEARLPLDGREMVTRTPSGIPGDPVNIGFVASRAELLRAFAESAWNPADPVTLASAVEIGLSVALDRPYKDAPISALVFDGRTQDLALEKQDGPSADRRRHVRLWRISGASAEGRDFWLGSASYDRGVGISHTTGEVTHHIAPDVDAERDYVAANIAKNASVEATVTIPGVGPTWEGRNGGGDLYFTDGNAVVVFLAPAATP